MFLTPIYTFTSTPAPLDTFNDEIIHVSASVLYVCVGDMAGFRYVQSLVDLGRPGVLTAL